MRVVPVMIFLCACVVPKRTYQDALAAHEADRQAHAAAIAERDAAIAALTAERDEAQAQRDALQRELDDERARLEAELATITAELESTRDSLTRALAGRASREAEIEEMRVALAELERRKAKAEAALAEFRDLVARFQRLIDAGTLSVRVIDGRMVVQLATDVLFDPGKADVSPAGRAALAEVAGVLASIPNRQFQVAGHTDNVPIATERFPSNWYLGAARAIAVVGLLQEGGLAPERVSAASYAEFKPADTNRTPEGRANNRRIEIVVVPDLSELPGYDELSALGSGDE